MGKDFLLKEDQNSNRHLLFFVFFFHLFPLRNGGKFLKELILAMM